MDIIKFWKAYDQLVLSGWGDKTLIQELAEVMAENFHFVECGFCRKENKLPHVIGWICIKHAAVTDEDGNWMYEIVEGDVILQHFSDKSLTLVSLGPIARNLSRKDLIYTAEHHGHFLPLYSPTHVMDLIESQVKRDAIQREQYLDSCRTLWFDQGVEVARDGD